MAADDSIVPKSVPPSRTVPFREDCWSDEATSTLVDTWGRRFMELNRGNLRQKDWQEVADAVNALHGHTKKTHRTDVQCKNRIDTLKKKYKIEKARVSYGPVTTSSWLFYSRLDYLIGSAVANKTGPPSKSPASPPMAVPLAHRKPIAAIVQPLSILPQKRSSPAVNDSYFRRNYSAVAAAAAAVAVEDEEEEESEEEEEINASHGLDWREQSGEGDRGEGDGIRSLARAIVRMGEMYERVEREKQKQMIDLEKQRMQFSKDLEVQRMQLFMNMQVQVEKLKQTNKQSGSNDK